MTETHFFCLILLFNNRHMQHRAIELCFRANKVEFLNKLQPIRRSRHVREFFTVRNGFLRQIRQQITISHAISQHKDSHHEGTAVWFFQGSIFGEWKSKGSLLWIYGKPLLSLRPSRRYPFPELVYIISGIWEDCPLVCHRLAPSLVNPLYPPVLRSS